MLVKINSKNVKELLSSGITPHTLEVIENAKKTGSVFRSKNDLINIGIPLSEIELLAGNVSYGTPDPEQDIQLATIHTEPSLTEYTLYVKYNNKKTDEEIQDIYMLDEDGTTKISYDNLVAGDNFTIFIKAPNGAIVDTQVGTVKTQFQSVKKAALNTVRMKIEPYRQIQTTNNVIGTPSKIKGKLISNKAGNKLEKIQIVFFAATASDAAGNPEYYPVAYAETETGGYFFSSPLQFRANTDYNNLINAKAVIAVEGSPSVNIKLEPGAVPADGSLRKGQLPGRVILYLEENNTGTNPGEDCGCGCNDLNFHEKKVLDEFSYYTVIRTTEPLIKANQIKDVEEINAEDLLNGLRLDADVRKLIEGLKAPTTLFRNFVNRNGFITKDNAGLLVKQAQLSELKRRLNKKVTTLQGRVSLDNDTQVDWDENPTIYEAVSIAHGHLLNFKQEWYSAGYSIGDLLYSLPLAPGQKKQIVVFDWDRKDSASNTQRLDYQESLYNSLSRDRDVNEVANATLKEKSFGGSIAGAGGQAGGVGGIVGGLIAGVAGGFGIGGSIAGQSSSRSTTASSQQNIHDRTVQAASSVRSQRSTVIQTVSQGERFQVSAEVIANYNHCHAMTVEYFEVLRHFEITTRLANVQECLFIPLAFSPFDRKKALRWRDILSANLTNRELRKGFAAIERIEEELESAAINYYDQIGFPRNSYSELPLRYVEGEVYIEFQLQRPADKIENDGSTSFLGSAWDAFTSFIPNSPIEFFERFIKGHQKKDDSFFNNAGPSIAENLISRLEFYAIKRGQSAVKLPIDATLLSDFQHRVPLNVSLRMQSDFAAEVRREDIDFIEIRIQPENASWFQNIRNLLNAGVRMIVHSGSMRYRTDLSNDYLFRSSLIKNDLTVDGDNVRIFTPLNREELRNPKNEDIEACNSLLHHLNENLEVYHQVLWLNMDDQRRFLLLDGFLAPGRANGRSVASVVENKLIGIVGNCLVMPVAPGFKLDPTLDEKVDLFQHYYEDPLDPIHTTLPTKGVFAEAVMGKCNSCEKKDETRFWRWEESPIPDSPTTINPINTPVPQNIQPNLQGRDFPSPIINLQNAPALPDPQGYGSLVQLLSNPNLFRDITGLTENQRNALAAFQTSMNGAQSFAGMAKDLEMQRQNLQHSDSILDNIRNSPELTAEEKSGLIKDHLQQQIDGGQSKKADLEKGEPSLTKAAVDAAGKGQNVKATRSDQNGNSETLETGSQGIMKSTTSPLSFSAFPDLVVEETTRFDADPGKIDNIFHDFKILNKGKNNLLLLFKREIDLEKGGNQITRTRFENLIAAPNNPAELHIQIPLNQGAGEKLLSYGGGTKNAALYAPNAAIAPQNTLYLLPFPVNVDVVCTQSFLTFNAGNLTHKGDDKFAVDFSQPAAFSATGMEIFAARDGVVVEVKDSEPEHPSGYTPVPADEPKANFVKVIHSDNTYTKYGHIRFGSARVAKGDVVKAGQTILGMTGNNGFSTGPHLHFAIERTKAVSQQDITDALMDDDKNLVISYETLEFRFHDGSGTAIVPKEATTYKRI